MINEGGGGRLASKTGGIGGRWTFKYGGRWEIGPINRWEVDIPATLVEVKLSLVFF